MEEKARLERRDKRRRQILSATLRLLRRHGTGISTAQIAAEASCSKETLYSWFGDREGILRALVEEQAQGMAEALARSFDATGKGTFRDQLVSYCQALLDIMTGEAVLSVNRAAMAQACSENDELGNAVLGNWQGAVEAPFLELIAANIELEIPEEAFEVLMGLLVGDTQRKLLLGAGERPSLNDMNAKAQTAVDRWLTLFEE